MLLPSTIPVPPQRFQGKLVKSLTSAEPRATRIPTDTMKAEPMFAARFLLWIDAVGGYLVCQGDKLRIGQQAPGCEVELPIIGDLARHHATIWRDGESYLIAPAGGASLDGRPIDRTALLSSGMSIALGRSVQLRFRKPSPLSGSACLDLVSRHRTQPTTSGILLMADTLVLGPQAGSHIVCRSWQQQVVLHSLGGSLYCVTDGMFTVDGAVCKGRGLLKPGSHVVADDFSFSIEAG